MTHPLVLKGRQAFQAGDLRGALSLSDLRLGEASDDLDALELKAVVLQRRNDLKGAEAVFRQAIAIDPASAWAANDLTLLLHSQGQRLEAETAAREALAARPDDPQAHLQLGVILAEKDDLPAAEFHNRRALDLAGPHPQILLNLGLCLYSQGQMAEAEQVMLQAHKAAPDTAMVMAHLAKLYEAKRDLKTAFAWLERAETIGRKTGEDFALLRARLLAAGDRSQEALDLIDRSADGQTGGDVTGGDMGASAMLERGRLLDRLGRFDEAWPALIAAKARLTADSGARYEGERVAAQYAGLKAFFSRDTLGRLPRARTRSDMPQPIFILGLPRSGTTMLEQMLSSHPMVQAGGELPFVYEWQALIRNVLPGERPFPDKLALALAADYHHVIALLRDYYLGRIEAYGVAGQQPLFTDKMPLNEVYLPLIRLAFPDAAVIRMVRHPLDVAVSVLSHDLTHGQNFGYGVGSIIAHMTATHELNRHYDGVLDRPATVLRYEDFVTGQEAQTRRILEVCGLDFDAACLRFHENPRHAPTPSYAQVTKPLNDRSVGRWRAYKRYFEPFMAQIAPVVTDLGYSV